jgi:hypothetical protein
MDACGTPATQPVRGIELTSSFSLHAERQTIISEERWFSAGNDRVTLDYRDSSRLETFVSYDAQGAAALSLSSDWPGQGKPPLAKFDIQKPQPFEFNVTRQPPPPPPSRPQMDVPHDTCNAKDGKDLLEEDSQLSYKDRLILLLLRKFFGFGDDVKFLDPKQINEAVKSGEKAAQEIRQATEKAPEQASQQAPPRSSAWVDAGVRRTTEVKEQVEFEAELRARVDDGKGGTVEQSVSVKLRASREFFQQEEVTLQAGERPKKDPLVLDLTGAGIDLTGVEDGTVFDLNGDGVAEKSATVRGGTGLLWMDRNGNGQLDDGSELFGDVGGATDGFEALSAMDTNGDGRVDLQDASFENLRLRLDHAGQAQDVTLQQAGVASLELQHVALPASLGDSASVDALGVFQRTDGSLGTMADVQLAYEA